MTEDKKASNIVVTGWWLVGISGAFILIILILFIVKSDASKTLPIDPAIFGQYGDIIGGVAGTFVALVGVLFLYETLTLQRKQIEDQKTQFNLQIKEQENQLKEERYQFRQQLDFQREQFLIQQMDSSFFNMVNILNKITSDIQVPAITKRLEIQFSSDLRGIHAMHLVVNLDTGNFQSNLSRVSVPLKGSPEWTIEDLRREVSDSYIKLYKQFPNQLGHFNRYVYNIIKYIREAKIEHPDKLRYINLLKAQISTHELGLIFYNAISEPSRNGKGILKFRELLDEYGFLENIDPASLKHNWHHWFYPQTEFKFLEKAEIEEKKEYLARGYKAKF